MVPERRWIKCLPTTVHVAVKVSDNYYVYFSVSIERVIPCRQSRKHEKSMESIIGFDGILTFVNSLVVDARKVDSDAIDQKVEVASLARALTLAACTVHPRNLSVPRTPTTISKKTLLFRHPVERPTTSPPIFKSLTLSCYELWPNSTRQNKQMPT
jgi:hypothetical protein